MQARVFAGGQFSDTFPITTGVAQGCVIASSFFFIFFGAMLVEALAKCSDQAFTSGSDPMAASLIS